MRNRIGLFSGGWSDIRKFIDGSSLEWTCPHRPPGGGCINTQMAPWMAHLSAFRRQRRSTGLWLSLIHILVILFVLVLLGKKDGVVAAGAAEIVLGVDQFGVKVDGVMAVGAFDLHKVVQLILVLALVFIVQVIDGVFNVLQILAHAVKAVAQVVDVLRGFFNAVSDVVQQGDNGRKNLALLGGIRTYCRAYKQTDNQADASDPG